MPHMAHCVKVVLEDVCTKSLQQEELSHTSGSAHMVLTNTPHRDDSSLTCPERDRPKMVAKVSIKINTNMTVCVWSILM